MALLTAGTSTATVLRALAYSSNMSVADLAQLNAYTEDEYSSANPLFNPGTVFQNGMLYYPHRGALRLFPGDYIVADPVSGFFQVINAAAFAGGSYVHS